MNRNLAVLGVSDSCIASYPGDFAVALVAFNAKVVLEGESERRMSVDDFFLLPGSTPDREHPLAPGEMITAIEIPRSAALARLHYLKVRDRASYEFAASRAAVGLEMEADGVTIRDVRIALGGVATIPWRASAVEAALKGQRLDEATLRAAAALAVEGAQPGGHNDFKIALATKVVARALMSVGEIA